MRSALPAALLAGLLLGWYATHNHYQGRLAKAERQQAAAEHQRREQLATLSEGYYEAYQDAINREPATVERRVYVKGDCVPGGQSSRVGDAADAGGDSADTGSAGSAGKVALSRATVEAVADVTARYESLYRQCTARLEYFQNAYSE